MLFHRRGLLRLGSAVRYNIMLVVRPERPCSCVISLIIFKQYTRKLVCVEKINK